MKTYIKCTIIVTAPVLYVERSERKVTAPVIRKEISRLVRNKYPTIATATPSLLPAMHSTNCVNSESMIKDDALFTTLCPVFEEPLLYLFYGKPSYKVSAKTATPRTDSLLSPCCFIVDTAQITAKYIFPFDSGAYKAGMYSKIIPDRISIHAFELDQDISLLPNFIRLFFGDNNNYLDGKCTVQDRFLSNSVTVSLGELLKSTGTFPFDDRAKTVEIISDCSIKISDAVMAMIIPLPFLRNEYLDSFIRQNPTIDIITYYPHYPIDPSCQNEAVYQKAREYLSQKGRLP